jgi:hypothetical protein
MQARQKPDGVVAGSSKRHTWRFSQVKTCHCLTGQHLHTMKSHPTPQCWWCASETQTRDHLFKECAEWREQQRILWAEVRKETGRWKSRWRVRDLLADERCNKAVLDFVSTTDVGRLVPAPIEEDTQSEASEWKLWRGEKGKRRGEQRLRSWAPRSRNPCSSPRLSSWHLQKRSESSSSFHFVILFVISLVRLLYSWDRPGQRAKESLQRAAIARTAAGKRSKMYAAIV